MNNPFNFALSQAVNAFQAGDLVSAEGMLKRILQAQPNNLPALHILGLIKAMQLKHAEAVGLFQKAVRISPAEYALQYNLAKALSESGRHKESLAHHKRAAELNSKNPEVWLNYGKSLSCLGRMLESLEIYDRALSLDPSYAEGHLNIGISLKMLGRHQEALIAYQKALSLSGDHYPEAHFHIGALFHSLGRYEEALMAYEKALNLKSSYAEAWLNKGVTYSSLFNYEEALASYDKALSINLDYAEAWFNRGTAFHGLEDYEQALASYDKALNINPDYVEAWSNGGTALCELKRYQEALFFYEKALNLNPDYEYLLGNLVYTKLLIGDWKGLVKEIKTLEQKAKLGKKAVSPLVGLAIFDSPALQLSISKLWTAEKYPLKNTHSNIVCGSRNKIRLAYISADFMEHPVSFLAAEMFELHDRARFEVFAISLKDAPPQDAMRKRLKCAFDRFIDVEGKSDQEIAELVKTLEIDIAIDLGGHTKFGPTGVFSYRVAPVQVNYLGYPGTSGAPYMDYIFADKVLIPPESQDFYTEKIVYLPNCFQVNDTKRGVPEQSETRTNYRLPDSGFIFCCFNNNYKFNPEVFAAWMEILRKTNNSFLWLVANNDLVSVNLSSSAKNAGVDPARLIFSKRAPHAEYLSRYLLADLFLDTLPFNAGTTASDALWAGLPVLTQIGESFSGRMAASLLQAVGLPELIAVTRSEYVALAIELASNPKVLMDIKEKLAENRSKTPLFNTKLLTEQIEHVYTKMHERAQSNLSPDHINLPLLG